MAIVVTSPIPSPSEEGPTPRQRSLFDACVGALKAAESKLKAGALGGDIDAAVRAHFGSLGLADHFVTHTGHGIGLGHPEPPYLIPDCPEKLVEGGHHRRRARPLRRRRRRYEIRIEITRITAEGFETLSKHEIRIDQ